MAKSSGLDLIAGRMARYGGLRVERTRETIQVLAGQEAGFDIRVADRSGRLAVRFDSWERIVDDADTAWNLIAVGLSNGGRLRLEPTKDGRTLCWLEVVLPDGSWRTLPEDGIEPNRLNAAVYYRQNGYVRALYRDQQALVRGGQPYASPMSPP